MDSRFRGFGWCLVIVVATCVTASAQPAEYQLPYYDIGDFHYPVSTKSPVAQQWFDRGLAMCIAFNHEEGVRCFERAIAADAGLAMAYWGLARSSFDRQWEFLQEAIRLKDTVSEREQLYIKAWEDAYTPDDPPLQVLYLFGEGIVTTDEITVT